MESNLGASFSLVSSLLLKFNRLLSCRHFLIQHLQGVQFVLGQQLLLKVMLQVLVVYKLELLKVSLWLCLKQQQF